MCIYFGCLGFGHSHGKLYYKKKSNNANVCVSTFKKNPINIAYLTYCGLDNDWHLR